MQSGDVIAVEQMLRELGEREGGRGGGEGGGPEEPAVSRSPAPHLHRWEPVSSRAHNTNWVVCITSLSFLPPSSSSLPPLPSTPPLTPLAPLPPQ